jgi:hypothetical protein
LVGDVPEEQERLTFATPADDFSLRGLPCIGARVGRAIRYTSPEPALLAKESYRL